MNRIERKARSIRPAGGICSGWIGKDGEQGARRRDVAVAVLDAHGLRPARRGGELGDQLALDPACIGTANGLIAREHERGERIGVERCGDTGEVCAGAVHLSVPRRDAAWARHVALKVTEQLRLLGGEADHAAPFRSMRSVATAPKSVKPAQNPSHIEEASAG